MWFKILESIFELFLIILIKTYSCTVIWHIMLILKKRKHILKRNISALRGLVTIEILIDIVSTPLHMCANMFWF